MLGVIQVLSVLRLVETLLAPLLQPLRNKTQTYHAFVALVLPFCCDLCVGVFVLGSDWFIGLCAPVALMKKEK